MKFSENIDFDYFYNYWTLQYINNISSFTESQLYDMKSDFNNYSV